ncbi:hypothetical protein BV898_10328 [Hypsibius exemplaris]|uniref:Uncharacterized protein n=1 Tax=Hypsibius exemplaris TaxID=2072580 RepID=A0A1W0WK02_HYPEX|nr:hypothetical protein BV898_10328 [Hypsibius exemplaris]
MSFGEGNHRDHFNTASKKGRGPLHISEQTPGDEKDARAKPGTGDFNLALINTQSLVNTIKTCVAEFEDCFKSKSGDSAVTGVHFVKFWELGGFLEADLFGRGGNGVICRYVPTSQQRNQPRATYDPRMKYQNIIREEAQRMVDKEGL